MNQVDDAGSPPAFTYIEVAAKLRFMASEAKSAETRDEFTRLAGLYERLAVRIAGGDAAPEPPVSGTPLDPPG